MKRNVRGLGELFRDYMSKNPKLAKELAIMMEEIKSLRVMVDTIAKSTMDYEDTKKLWKSRIFFRDMKHFSSCGQWNTHTQCERGTSEKGKRPCR